MKKFIAIVMCALSLAACGITGGDPLVAVSAQERFVQADGDYKALVATIREAVVKGYIVKDTPLALNVSNAVTTLRLAIDVWQVAPGNMNSETAVLVALQSLRVLISTINTGDQANACDGELSCQAA